MLDSRRRVMTEVSPGALPVVSIIPARGPGLGFFLWAACRARPMKSLLAALRENAFTTVFSHRRCGTARSKVRSLREVSFNLAGNTCKKAPEPVPPAFRFALFVIRKHKE